MMKHRTTKAVVLALGLVLPLLASGCASEPTMEIDAADVAFESALQAEAEAYAPLAMEIATEAHAALETELATQKEHFALRRSYQRTLELAAEAKRASEEAAEAAREGKQQAREDATSILAELRTTTDEVKVMLENAPTGKGSAADLAVLRGDFDGVDFALAEIEQAISSERFLEAIDKAHAAKESADQIRAELEGAAEAQRSARSRRG